MKLLLIFIRSCTK